jgi:cardiolipin synthase A/B
MTCWLKSSVLNAGRFELATVAKSPMRVRPRREGSAARLLADQVFSRAAGAPLVSGNGVRLLKDGEGNYSAWLDAFSRAKQSILFESYIVHDDVCGDQFAEAFIECARRGVKVYLLYDWLGGFMKTSLGYWRRLRKEGVEVRCFNRFQLSDPIGSIMRDHRKTVVVDGRVGFVTGLCIGKMWQGDKDRGIEPWRDTGIEIAGPAVSDLIHAFGRAWETAGEPLPGNEFVRREEIPRAGDVDVRVVATEPQTSGLYRLDQLIAAAARWRLWLTDAYFAGTPAYVQALIAAAQDGVDVRLLVPGASDIPVLNGLSRVGYRPLLEGGVRVFEWNSSMMHAKTAVADGTWARVGSTNLNLASWLSNWELDVAVENEAFAREMEEMYTDDLSRSTEIVLNARRKVASTGQKRLRAGRGSRLGSAGRVVAGALSLGKAVDAAISKKRELGAADAQPIAFVALMLFVLATIAFRWPRGIAYPMGVIGAWLALALLLRAVRLDRLGRRKDESAIPEPEFEDEKKKAQGM